MEFFGFMQYTEVLTNGIETLVRQCIGSRTLTKETARARIAGHVYTSVPALTIVCAVPPSIYKGRLADFLVFNERVDFSCSIIVEHFSFIKIRFFN